MHGETAPDFRAASTKALDDPQIRANFRRAMDGLMAKRAAQFPDPGDLLAMRDLCTAIRARSLLRLPELLEQLEALRADIAGNSLPYPANVVAEKLELLIEALIEDAEAIQRGDRHPLPWRKPDEA